MRSLLFALCLATPAAAQPVEVDVELLLMVDVSRSMTARELEIQRRGYAAALRSDEVHAAIRNGLLQRIAVSYVEWAGTQEVVVPWRVLDSRADLDAFATDLTAQFDPAIRRTSISGALAFGAASIRDNAFHGLRRVIDVSGDGPNNLGAPVTRARDAALAEGLIINGLPLLTREGMGSDWHLDHLDVYYETCVIGGPGAFVIPVLDWEDFAAAVRRKLVLEIAAPAPTETVVPAQALLRDPRDCLIGEKIWQNRRDFWGMP